MSTAGAPTASRTSPSLNNFPEDQQSLSEARSGSRIAFADIQRRHSTRLYKTIRSTTRNHEDAEDALQDAFLRAFRGLHTFEGRSQLSTWLTSIAINSALMVVRKRRAHAEVQFYQTSECGEDTPFFEVPDSAPDPKKSYELKQRHGQILKALERLDPKSRTAIEIWMVHDCSIKDLARMLDVSLGTAKSRLHRSRVKIAHYHGSTADQVMPFSRPCLVSETKSPIQRYGAIL